jgi:ABC-type phosphate/phosphonate transport system substrate-binding protein
MIAADKIIEELEDYLMDQLGIDIETFFNAFEIKEKI